ncbi:MAG: DUF998 domain-containing protein [Candidatus Aenigmarchaeota archaeon]|nr:DUF998 domain-containing protein [Candidatus Aenigmarchaeota archaeon]NIP40859.1 DUF998 domain-containing protein [Candidatus Aenigmarchaeota archaeon]NIQ17973.1 DUF998 domain-containing protein [Candidatus Aenigmarchaeota archaeon]NIS73562.1 DUF998 domain-containing protein [Candidatus Aenigmarchaeota archaeon]
MNPRLERFLILSGLLSSAIFLVIAVPLGFFFPGYNHFDDVVSKQGAVDSPIMLQANILFFLFGFFMFLFGIGLYRNYAENWAGRIGSFLIILSGISVACVGLFPCDPGCVNVSVIGVTHQFVSESPLVLGLFGIILFVIHELTGGGFRKEGKNFMLYLFVVFIILGVVFGYIHLELDPVFPYPGLFQRIAIGLPSTLIVIASLYIYREMGNIHTIQKQRANV